ncbi:MAG TPA: N-6 DNA methylase [Syntrophorhabdaceae bacterium]|nr:N-6 DNA methylase [Syntrophorhabdaceae bacterium]
MARRVNEFQTIRSEGGLLPSDLLRRIIDPKEKIPGTEPQDYGLPHGDRINETITQSWNRLRRHWAEFSDAVQKLPEGEPGTGVTNDKWNLPLLRELGFGLLPTTAGPEIEGRTYAINRFLGPTAIHLIGCNLSLDRRAAGVRGAASANPHGLVQEFLNRAEGYLWGIVSNGLRFRILRDNQALSRQSYLEFDLEAMFIGEVFSDFVLLWLVAHATRFTVSDGGRPEGCWLEQWTKLAEEQGTRALESLKGGVEKALEVLGQGFVGHPRNTALRENLRTGALSPGEFHGQLLRVVYRLIFLFVAEDRTLEGIPLIHARDDSEEGRQARERYAIHYSTARLRELAANIRGSRHGDLWHQFSLLVGAVSGDDRFVGAREHLALPVLGSFLWSAVTTEAVNAPNLTEGEGTELANTDFLEAIRHLAFTRQGKVLRPVDYKNLGSEELGGVYESFLALTPQISGDGTRFSFAEFAGNERKTSGSYYTPDSLVQCLLDSALDPVVEEATKGKVDAEAEKAILSLKICDPAVGSGHFLVGAAHRLARHLARIRAIAQGESEPSPPVYQHALRDVIGHCLYGVDINPMAAELCRVSLWLDALEPGKPLSFLDHHIRVGNSLLGTTPELIIQGIPDDAFKPIEGDDKKACAELKKRNKVERKGLGPLFAKQEAEIQAQLAKAAAELEELPDDRPEDVDCKELVFRNREEAEEYRHKKLLADAWCAAFVIKKYLREPGRESSATGITQGNLNDLVGGKQLPNELNAEVERLADLYQFFHWHLAFPEAFARGGFDCVLGNPPWETMELSDKEFFAESNPTITAADSRSRRKTAIQALEKIDPRLYQAYEATRRRSFAIRSLIQNSGLYPLSAFGRINSSSLFTELAFRHSNKDGYLGMIVPSSLLTDAYNRYFFDSLFSGRNLVCAYDFENRSHLFSSVHPQFRFCLLTITRHIQPNPTVFVYYAHDPSELTDRVRRICLSPDDVACMNPNTKTMPILITQRDAELCLRSHRKHPILHQEVEDVNLYKVEFWTTFYIKEASAQFLPNKEQNRKENSLAVYEGKMCHQFDHRFASFAHESTNIDTVPASAKENPWLFANPRYVVSSQIFDEATQKRLRFGWFLGVRDITNATNERTCIAFVYPRLASFDTIRNMTPTVKEPELISAFIANLNSFMFDYLSRQKVSGTHFTFSYSKQVAIVSPEQVLAARFQDEPASCAHWMRDRVLELTYTAWDLEAFARDCGYNGPPFRWDEGRRFLLRCELDAAFFHLYLGSEEEWRKEPESLTSAFPTPRHAVDYIMETFPIVKRKDESAHGTYRTKDTIVEIYDALTDAIRAGQPYQTRLDPPPGPPADNKGNFLPLFEWKPGQPKPADWPSHIHAPKGCS